MNSILPTLIADNPLAEKLVRKIAGSYLEKKYYQDFFKTSDYSTANSGSTILLYSGISSMYLTPIEILFYHALRQQGFNVDYLVYDESIKYNEVTTKARLERDGNKFWKRSVNKGLAQLKSANVQYQTISLDEKATKIVASLPNNIDALFEYTYDGYAVGDIVKGVMYRYYQSISMGSDAIEVAKNFMATTLTNYFEIKRRCENTQYHSILFSHGIYCTWQIIVDYCQHENLDFVCYDRGKTKGCINVNRNQPSPVWDISDAWLRLENYSLTEHENTLVDQYLTERETQKGDVFAYNFSEKSNDLNALKQQLGITSNKKVITVFTNLIWDAANVSRDIAFNSPIECIEKTIRHYKQNDNVHILIRSHPAEKVIGTNERYGQLVRALFNNQLPSNVTIIEPEMNINSFDILDISTIGIIHTSTVGLEMALKGKPVILISETHYREKGFTYDASSEENYFATLDDLLVTNKIKTNQVALARKYFYFMMFEYQHSMPLLFTQSGSFNGYKINNIDLLRSDVELSFNKIISTIKEKHSDFIFHS